ncbi:site-specific integrase [Sphingobium terrigena]|uniref:Site-specific integrase n=1 Tax=Sphingobium terrigena TaxID=2304063 RepID=A0A418YRG0_9SPHN|nr:tyrosine-type recombinase/integrase [Sphingobium terrigena]RJG54225.1 site-specific integrase [Sphingobium terrigena]
MSHMQLGDWQPYDEAGRRKYVNGAERKRFLHAADQMGNEVRALCHVLAYSGCRISEALNLTRDHIDQERGALVIRTLKRRRLRFRMVPIPRRLIIMLAAMPQHDNGRIFSMHRSTAWRQVKQVMLAADISGPMATAKGLRHGYGICAAGKSVPPNLIQKWLGHASGVTTAIYLDAVGVEEREFAERMW